MAIPNKLLTANSWICWNADKVPFSAVTKKPFSSKNKEQELASFFACSRWLEYEKGNGNTRKLKGLGFYLDKTNGVSCIDLDSCINEDRTLTPLARELVELFKDTYIEKSQSGKGLHIWVLGTIDSNINTKEIEIYSNERYIALTDNVFNYGGLFGEEKDLVDHQKELEELVRRYSKEKALERAKNGNYGTATLNREELTEESLEVISIIANSKKAEEFNKLYGGNIEGYKSQSEGDMALIGLLNYFAKGNEEVITNIFLNSALANREKAFREDYIKRTIEKAKSTLKTAYIEHRTNNSKRRVRADIKEKPIYRKYRGRQEN